jgi:hypothetical protein
VAQRTESTGYGAKRARRERLAESSPSLAERNPGWVLPPIVYRAELIRQAARTYRRMLRAAGTTARAGWSWCEHDREGRRFSAR